MPVPVQRGQNALLAAHGPLVDAEGLGDGGAGDVGVQNADLIAQLRPWRRPAEQVTMLLPTPPLPLTTPMTWRMTEWGLQGS